MQTKLLEGFGGALVEQWATRLLTPAFAFWLGGLLAWGDRHSWTTLIDDFNTLTEPLQIALLIVALLIVVASGFAIQRFDLTILRLFEGYWPPFLEGLRRWCVNRQQKQRDRLLQRWQTLLIQRDQAGLQSYELEELTAIDTRLRQWPSQRDRIMPTPLGNLLRAAETRPDDKYGLDAIICWPRFWLLLPDTVKTELQAARADLNSAARLFLWGVLFVGWVVLGAWWAVPLGLGVAWFAHRWMLEAAMIYGDLVESAFDLHRMDLYQSLRFPLPQDASEEKPLGRELSAFLWRGSDRPDLKFTHSNL